MKRIAFLLLLGGICMVPAIWAQEASGAQSKEEANAAAEEKMIGWRWANFIILAGVLVYFGMKLGKPYFAAQTQGIQQGLEEARARREDAERRSAEVQRKLANLGAEIDVVRETALREQAAKAENLRGHTRAEMERIQTNAAQQIQSVGKRARLDLRREASRLAIELAEQRLRAKMNPELQNSLIGQFVHSLETTSGRADWKA